MHSNSYRAAPPPPFHLCRRRLLILLFISICTFNAGGANAAGKTDGGDNPFTPKAYLLRYWNKHVSNDLPKPEFLIAKASPLTAAQYVGFTKLADEYNSLSTRLTEFCSQANLLCFPDSTPILENHDGNVNFAGYSQRNFTNYGTNRAGGTDGFKNYTLQDVFNSEGFRRYSRVSTGHNDNFNTYITQNDQPNVEKSFHTYGTGATAGESEFTNYNYFVNTPSLNFTSYSDSSNGREQSFKNYTYQANSGFQSFVSYGKKGNDTDNEFKSYGDDSNVIESDFNNYGENGDGAKDSFTSYDVNIGNVPTNTFKNYAANGNSATETFATYRERANVGDDTFDSYGKKSDGAKLGFTNYGRSYNPGSVSFNSYGKDATKTNVDFKLYGHNATNSFTEYAKGTTFSTYSDDSTLTDQPMAETQSGKKVNKWVEPGKFFREAMLKPGTVMPMPDIRDKMPKRAFLPRAIAAKLPFSSSKIGEIEKIFQAGDGSRMSKMVTDAVHECEREPSPGETKRCVASIEDMIDFATSVLGRSVAVRTTETTDGSKGKIMIGEVKGINGGKVTKSVSCHQSLYPYLVYYCHSVPKVRVYEADILDPSTKSKINHGVAICHVDTTSWSATHGAFIALGPGPGKIEVCHWIFENDMTWATADTGASD